MTQMQQGLDQNIGQAYISNITAQNAAGGAQGGAAETTREKGRESAREAKDYTSRQQQSQLKR